MLHWSAVVPLPPNKTHNIIGNVLLADKLLELSPELIKKEKIKHVIAILPENTDHPIPIEHSILRYSGHNPEINFKQFETYCNIIEDQPKETNVLIFCNNGYQRSIPFLVYYLINFHKEEFPTLEKAVEHVNVLCESTVEDIKYLFSA